MSDGTITRVTRIYNVTYKCGKCKRLTTARYHGLSDMYNSHARCEHCNVMNYLKTKEIKETQNDPHPTT
jgi:DNA-directed RNA polymerase subunit RPC12/RpoP